MMSLWSHGKWLSRGEVGTRESWSADQARESFLTDVGLSDGVGNIDSVSFLYLPQMMEAGYMLGLPTMSTWSRVSRA